MVKIHSIWTNLNCCIWPRWVVFGQNSCTLPKCLYFARMRRFHQNGLYLPQWVVFGQMASIRPKYVIFGQNMVGFGQMGCLSLWLPAIGSMWQNGCIWAKWLHLQKIESVIFGKYWLCLVKVSCTFATHWLYLAQMVVFGHMACIWIHWMGCI